MALAKPYKICVDGNQETVTPTLSTVGISKTEYLYYSSYNLTRTYQTYKVQINKVPDARVAIRISYQWRVSYTYPASAGWSAYVTNYKTVYIQAGQTSVTVDLDTSLYYCKFGEYDGNDQIFPYQQQ